MPRLRCPRCATVVEVAAGARPSCSSCGFGAKAAPQAAVRPAIPVPPPAMVGRPAPAPRKRRTGTVVAIVLASILVVGMLATAGWMLLGPGEASRLSAAEAESRVAAALATMPATFSGEPASDDLRRIEMRMEPEKRTPSGPEDFFGAFGKMEVTVEHGRGGTARFDLAMRSGAITVAFTMLCTPTQTFMLAGGETYGSRPAVEPDAEACAGMEDMGGGLAFFGLGGDFEDDFGEVDDGGGPDNSGPLSPLEGLEAGDADITRRADGTVRAELSQDGADVVLELDDQGRLLSIVMDSPQGTFTVTYEYGPRSTIPIPSDYGLLPAEVKVDSVTNGAVQTWTVVDSPQEPPLADFEVRVQDWGSSFGYGEDDGPDDRMATFSLTTTPQTQGNFTFRFTDADGDGKLTVGDSYTVEDLEKAAELAAEAQEDEAAQDAEAGDDYGFEFDFEFDFDFPTYHAVLYDVEADGPVNSTPMEMPVPSAAWLALAVLALAVALRRRA